MRFAYGILARLGFLILLAAAPAVASPSVDELARGFSSPPASARPWVYWFWMDGNLSREGITADLEAMQRAGIGGVLIMEVNVGIPRGPVKFMSEPWRALFKHAMSEAARLGLEVTLNAGPGWTGSGGPWVKPEESMQHLVASTIQVTGPSSLNADLPQPVPREPHFVHAPIPTQLQQARKDFYRDVAVIAFPTPAEGPGIADSDEKALYYRNPYSSMPGVKAFLPMFAEYPASPAGTAIARDAVVDLTNDMTPDGRLSWVVPPGKWTIMRFGRTTTGANTRPSPEPAIGFECDKFDRAGLDAHFKDFVGALLKELGPQSPSRQAGWTMLHIDSWEMGSQNWTAGFRDEFRRRRGYDPLPYLPAMLGRVVENLETSERFLWDLRQTANELIVENYAGHLKDLAHGEGVGLSIEPYDLTPCADLSLGGVADVPMCEFWSAGYGFDTTFSCIEAVSIGHTRGRPVVAAEAFTAGDQEAWRLHPGNMKRQADWALCFGINRLVFHRYAHQPWLDRWPGMTMGPYGVHYERTQTWWEMSDAWHKYLSRCQFLLRQGTPVADTCYLSAEGAPHVFRPPTSALSGQQPLPDRRGYNFDGCAPDALIRDMSVQDGRLALPGGMSYRVLVLPRVATMTPALLRKVRELVEAGATIIGAPPLKSPSLSGYPQCDEEVKRITDDLWGGGPAPQDLTERRYGRGRIFWSSAMAPAGSVERDKKHPPVHEAEVYADFATTTAVLQKLGIAPDFQSDQPLRYTHRQTEGVEIYFLANGQARAVQVNCDFRVSGRRPEIWNPVSGRMQETARHEEKGGRTLLSLSLEPSGSLFVVFRSARPSRHNPKAPAGETSVAAVQLIQLEGPWQVRFQPHRGAPEQVTFDTLLDWTKHPDLGVKYFSGTAAYTKVFTIPSAIMSSGQRLELDLGRVEVMARVNLNGRDLGVLWTSPFRVEITDAAKAGENTLEITVANLWPNRLIGDQLLPEGKRVAWTTWNPFHKDSLLLESGLIGPVTLRRLE